MCTQAAVTSYSTSATVPGVKSTASLSAYANVAAFNTAERLKVSLQIGSGFWLSSFRGHVAFTVLVVTAVYYSS